ncbi:hypothetical protein L249_3036 [Ophiocordyceps polyrhachis-furcata BCC 54312]|uniref:Ecp2 effector protein-like domain-containing protein n=1 Tax=Ophiocordyceps polyrhachis-furcata BCC 54312 TaxID=1330021 RepID=A0A367LR62_9HYPO|nr:hypothetical protein L249_3036 [Ophiocordyceps polyrhachis-furcata BCC 54312]
MAPIARFPLFTWALAVLLASSLANAAAISGAPFKNITGVSWRSSQAGLSTCDSATFAYDLSLDAADWRQCAALHSEWTTEKGFFRVSRPGRSVYVPILSGTGCSLAVEPHNPLFGPYIIGNQDIEHILFHSLREFSRGTLLAVNGNLSCDASGTGVRVPLAWKISKPTGPSVSPAALPIRA